MSLQFIFGNAGSGKSDYLYTTVLEQAQKYPDKNFLIIVPEQFTMQTQRELVQRQKKHAIMNVDVLSFARLAYRVFDELGKQELVVLEETGKNLVLRKVAEQKKQELRILGANMNKMGYVGEVKSLISEMTQYNVTPDELEQFLNKDVVSQTLKLKLSDVLTMYRGFREYLKGRYITAEEVLTLLCDVADESKILKDSVIVFDEFTGFTPIQNQLLEKLLTIADKIMISVTMDKREDFYHSKGIHELFAMSKKTVQTVMRMAQDLYVEIENPHILESGEKKRYKNAPALYFMEQNLFRPFAKKWNGDTENLSIYMLKEPWEEMCFVAREITQLVRERGYRYRDIAVVTGDVPGYAHYVPEIFQQYEIPYFIDQTRNILFHPFIECLRSALEVVEYDFSYESIFRFLRCGLAERIIVDSVLSENVENAENRECQGIESRTLTAEDIDLLENYIIARGIRGHKKWKKRWIFRKKEEEFSDEERKEQQHLNEIRESIASVFEPLFEAFKGNEHTVEEQTYALYRFICTLHTEEQLKKKEEEFFESDPVKAQEYAQIYKIVMDLLDKVSSLLGEEKISIREYGDILDAGFSAAKVGTIPPGNDRVMIGDIERTRLNHIKVLFFVGVNDGVVPKKESAGSIISQFEREKMAQYDLELAPGARERVFIQKFYLYLNMTKPSDLLYVTFSKIGANGKAMRRSYLIGTLLAMFSEISVKEWKEEERLKPLTPASSVPLLVEGLQQAAEQKAQEEHWKALAKWYFLDGTYKHELEQLLQAAFFTHTDDVIGYAVTRALYGTTLRNSVTRLERFAACAFAHYLDYGLMLKERETQEFAGMDMGNIYHDALEFFAERVKQSEYTWFDMPQELQSQWIEESMEDAILGCRDAGIFEDAKNRYLVERMKATMRRTVWALVTQIQKGNFEPSEFEVTFSHTDNLNAIQFSLGDDEKMRLRGRIDRVDVCEKEDKVYVKIIDYKSGNTKFSLLNLYYGLQLQLVVYLNAAMELIGKKYPGKEIEPAGIFYYHINDPIVEGNGTESDEEIRQAVLEQLKPGGLVNEKPEIYRAMDNNFSGASSVIPVSLKTDGTLKATSKTVSTEQFHTMSSYVNQVLEQTGRKILDGEVSVNPYRLENDSGCDFCPYHTICGFDMRMPGFSYRKLKKFDSAEDILETMQKACEEWKEMAQKRL